MVWPVTSTREQIARLAMLLRGGTLLPSGDPRADYEDYEVAARSPGGHLILRLQAGVGLGFGHHLTKVALVVDAIGVRDQHSTLVFTTAMTDDRCEVACAILGERGSLAFFHFRQRVEITPG